MTTRNCHFILLFIFLLVWMLVFMLPLGRAVSEVVSSNESPVEVKNFGIITMKSFALAALIAAVSVLLGYIPGKLLALSSRGKGLFLLMIVPLVLPKYVQYYAWSLLLSPTMSLGKYLSSNLDVARAIGTATAVCVLILWYWPLAGLLIANAWKNAGADVLDAAELETDRWQRFRHITLPLLWRSMALCFTVCMVLVLSEFSTFHLGGVRTIGTELAVLYELTASESQVLRASWPLVIAALAAGYFLHREVLKLNKSESIVLKATLKPAKAQWFVVAVLVMISVVAPLVIFIVNIQGMQEFFYFFKLHTDELLWSFVCSSTAVVLAFAIAIGAKKLEVFPMLAKILRPVVYTSIFASMLLPGSIVGVSILKTAVLFGPDFSQGWLVVSIGQAVRVCGVALILLELSSTSDKHHYAEMASVDGAGLLARFRYVYLGRNGGFVGAILLLLLMISITELPATMILLPAGVPNFAQRLLNQMHYARDGQVIASCLILIGTFVCLAVLVFALLRQVSRSRLLYLLVGMCVFAGGCKDRPSLSEANVVRVFGQTGRGKVEFVYPRAIDIAGDNLYVIDKVGRVQRITVEGEYVSEYSMPETKAGKPTGLSIAPDGNMYVADTHYHRIVVFSPKGELVKEFGQFGENEGEFIYPTDVAFAKDGRVFVSEYGGNDRINVFDEKGRFQYCFGQPGNGENQLSRPSAMCVDQANELLYVADACNHRIAVYTLDGQLVRYLCSVGSDAGCLRYPYDIAMTDDGKLIVCEFGNNRIQVLSRQGESLGVYGMAGREIGQLAYPWAVAVDEENAYIVDAGNNRIQVWQF